MPPSEAACPVLTARSSSLPTFWPVSATWNEDAYGYRSAEQEQERAGTPMIVYFYTDWCPYCRQFEQELLGHWEVERHLRSQLVKLRINPERGAEEAALAERFGIRGYPSLFLVCRGLPPERLGIHRSAESPDLKSPSEFIRGIERRVERITADLVAEGRRLRLAGEPAGSIAVLNQAAEASPKQPDVFYERGLAHLEEGSMDRALDDFRAALELRADYVEVFGHLALALQERGSWEESIACWTSLIEKRPREGQAHFQRARAHQARGDRARAREDAATACQLGEGRGCSLGIELERAPAGRDGTPGLAGGRLRSERPRPAPRRGRTSPR